jgi:hypothetical protein
MTTLGRGAFIAIAIGKSLLAAKALLRKEHGHAAWLDYLGLECRLGMRTAQIYMFLAKHEALLNQLLATNLQNSAFLSQNQALKLLSVARAKRRKPKKAALAEAKP